MIKEFRNLFESNLALLSSEVEFSKEDILKARYEECLDCRFVLIQIAREYKVPDNKISAFSGFTRQQLQRATEQTEQRMAKLDVKILLQKVRKNTEKFIANIDI